MPGIISSSRAVPGAFEYDPEEGSMTSIMNELDLKQRRQENRLILLHKGLNGYMQTSPSQTSTKTRGNNVKDTINSFKSHMLILILLKTALYQKH